MVDRSSELYFKECVPIIELLYLREYLELHKTLENLASHRVAFELATLKRSSKQSWVTETQTNGGEM